MSTSRRNYGKLVHSGMGGFLNPPGHPEHEWSIQSSYGDTFSMSLSAAAESDWLEAKAKGAAIGKLKSWKPMDLESEPVQDWIVQVLGYFKGCYAGQDKQGNQSWNVSDLRMDAKIDPVLNADLHAGVNLIRKYYPAFTPTPKHFGLAYWRTKPTVEVCD